MQRRPPLRNIGRESVLHISGREDGRVGTNVMQVTLAVEIVQSRRVTLRHDEADVFADLRMSDLRNVEATAGADLHVILGECDIVHTVHHLVAVGQQFGPGIARDHDRRVLLEGHAGLSTVLIGDEPAAEI